MIYQLILYIWNENEPMKKIEDVILYQIDLTTKVAKHYSQGELTRLGLGITIEQWIVLKIISENENFTQKELAEKSYRDPASITRTIVILEKKGFIARTKVPNNARAYYVSLTQEGAAFVDRNMKIIKQHRELSIKGLTSEELETLSNVLAKIRKNMS